MSTQITTRNPARDDGQATRRPHTTPGWAVAGIVAGAAGFTLTVFSSMVDAVYTPGAGNHPEQVVAELAHSTNALLGFHLSATVAVLALAVFGVGLHRRLRLALAEDSLLPGIAAFGILATAVVVLLGTGLDTEFIFSVGEPGTVVPEVAAGYNNWIGTVPWVWGLTGLTGISLFAASRSGALPRWSGVACLVLGVLSLLVTLAPLQYLAGWTGALMVLVTGLAFTLADRTR